MCHMARKCRNIPNNALHVDLTSKDPFRTMITEVNLVGQYDEWWIETGVSRHVCFDCAMLNTYTFVEDNKVLLEDYHHCLWNWRHEAKVHLS